MRVTVMMGQRDGRQRALQWRVLLSIGAVFAWLIFLVLWLFFLTTEFGTTQNIGIFLLSTLILVAVLAGTWVTWGLNYPLPPPPPGYAQYSRPRWRSIVSGVAVIIWLSFLVVWLFFYANQFSFYQNLGAILASLLVVGAVAWAIGQVGRGY